MKRRVLCTKYIHNPGHQDQSAQNYNEFVNSLTIIWSNYMEWVYIDNILSFVLLLNLASTNTFWHFA